MVSEKMVDALNKQINEELYSAYLYLAMSSYAGELGLKGVANWFMVQTKEEMSHGMRIYDYLGSRGAQPILQAIEQPPAKFEGAKEMFEAALKHEQHISSCFDELTELARDLKDHAAEIFLQWFVNEQVEEEESAREILDSLKLAGGSGLFMIDKELAQRVFTPSATDE